MDRVEQVEIQLGHLCNNRCAFCASGHITALGKVGQEDSTPALAHLADARARGARRVTFVGGEPTLQRDFPRILARARELGFEEIVLFTNGVRVQQREYFAELLRGGPLRFRVSIQGGDAETHDRVVGRQGAFQRILDGLELMRAHGQEITVNACLNALSYASVGGYPALARRYGVRQLHLDQVNPREIGDRPPGYLGPILARCSAQAPHLARMLDAFERELGADYDVNVGNVPFCVMPEWAHHIHHAGDPTLVVPANEDGMAEAGYDKYERKAGGKLKLPGCASCAFDPVCTGVFDEYADRFGTGELVPVPLERLARQRNAPRLFTLVARDRLARLRAAGAPPGFEPLEAEVSARDAQAWFRYRGPSGHEIAISVRHRDAPGTPLARGEMAALHWEGRGPAEEDLPLVGWMWEQLGERGGPALQASEARRRVAFAAAARASLARIVERLTASGEARDPRWSRDRDSASVAIRAGEEGDLRVRFLTQPAFERAPVRAVLPRPGGAGAGEPALARVVGAVRSALAARP
ncbi:MAG: radical SAM protein [Polyangiaceae bacterium]|nr:radical SAM protein [Polyangiaceae bacterium]